MSLSETVQLGQRLLTPDSTPPHAPDVSPQPGALHVLYIHHCAVFGGSSRSLLEMIGAFPPGTVRPYVITQRGRVAELCREHGFPVIATVGLPQFDNTRYGHYRGSRWLILLRELFYAPFALAALWKARRWKDIQLVHVNEITLALPALAARWLLRKPVVVHVRSVQEPGKRPIRTWLLRRILKSCASVLVPIDDTVKRSLRLDLPTCRVHNGFAPGCEPSDARPQPEFPARRLRVAMIGSLYMAKGVQEFIHAAKLCADRGLDCEFLVVGEMIRELRGIKGYLLQKLGLASDLVSDLQQFIQEHGLEDRVRFCGFALNISAVYKSVDIVCFPSRLNAAGRPVFEAALFHVPSIVAVRDPLPDTMVPGETGLCIEPDPAAIADAVEYFHRNPGEIRRMGDAARQLAVKNFDSRKNSLEMLEIYRSLVPVPKTA